MHRPAIALTCVAVNFLTDVLYSVANPAAKAGTVRILSEDMNARQIIAGIRVENPFA